MIFSLVKNQIFAIKYTYRSSIDSVCSAVQQNRIFHYLIRYTKNSDVSTSYTIINAIEGSLLETSIPGNIISDSEIDAMFFV